MSEKPFQRLNRNRMLPMLVFLYFGIPFTIRNTNAILMSSSNSRPLFPKEMFLWVNFYFDVDDFTLSFYNQLGFFLTNHTLNLKENLDCEVYLYKCCWISVVYTVQSRTNFTEMQSFPAVKAFLSDSGTF